MFAASRQNMGQCGEQNGRRAFEFVQKCPALVEGARSCFVPILSLEFDVFVRTSTKKESNRAMRSEVEKDGRRRKRQGE